MSDQNQQGVEVKEPLILFEIDDFKILMWDEGRYYLERRYYNPSTQKWESQRIRITLGSALVIRHLLNLFIEHMTNIEKIVEH